MLELRDFSVLYGAVAAVNRINLSLRAGEIGVIGGEFGAGKSSLLKAIFGNVRHRGQLSYDGRVLARPRPGQMARDNVALMHEGASVFKELTVRENITVAVKHPVTPAHIDAILKWFPSLTKHIDAPAFVLSGGQRQMLAFVRAIAPKPRLLLLDEPDVGLGKDVIETITNTISRLAGSGAAVLITEQSPVFAPAANRHWTMRAGRIHQGGTA